MIKFGQFRESVVCALGLPGIPPSLYSPHAALELWFLTCLQSKTIDTQTLTKHTKTCCKTCCFECFRVEM